MALNSLLSINPWVILLIISIITLGVIIFLTFTERILKRKVYLKQQKEDNSPARRIKLLISTHEDPKNKLRKINLIAKEIFRDAYNIDSRVSYYELADKFQKQGKKNAMKFCQEMFNILYAGKELQSKNVYELAKILEKINQRAQEEKSFKKLEKNMKLSLKISKQKDNLFKRFTNAENKFINKFARDKKAPTEQELSQTPTQTTIPTQALPTTKPLPIEYKTKRQKLQDLPLVKLFKFRKTPGITLTSEIEPDKIQKQFSPMWSSIRLKVPLLEKKKQEKKIKEISTYQKIDDLQREIINRQKQIDKFRTQQQIQKLQKTAVEIEINKEQWPPVTFTPKHLNEKRKMSPETQKSFEKANKEITLLEDEIKNKQKEMKKLQSRPIKRLPKPNVEKQDSIIRKIFGKSNTEVEKEIKRKQIEIINLKKETHINPHYSAPRVIPPKRQKIEFTPENKPLKKEEYIHHVDNMDRIKSRIRDRRANI